MSTHSIFYKKNSLKNLATRVKQRRGSICLILLIQTSFTHTVSYELFVEEKDIKYIT